MANRKPKLQHHRRLLVPYLADTYLVEVFAVLVGVVGFGLSRLLRPQDTKTALGILIGLLLTLVVQQFVERSLARSRRGRIEKIEAALTDKNMFDYIATLTESYRRGTEYRRESRHPGLYEEITDDLLTATDWLNLADGRLAIRDASRELTIARELLPSARERVFAVAVPSDLDYLESVDGLEYLREQADRIRNNKVEIRRLFIYSDRDAHTMDAVADKSLYDRIESIVDEHTAAGVRCRILNRDELKSGPPEIPDTNIYDDHTVRYSTLQLGAGRMQSVVSENQRDIREHVRLFESLWSQGKEKRSATEHPGSPRAGGEGNDASEDIAGTERPPASPATAESPSSPG